jgi:hypothetical protein
VSEGGREGRREGGREGGRERECVCTCVSSCLPAHVSNTLANTLATHCLERMLCHSRRAPFDLQGCGQGKAKAEEVEENNLILYVFIDHVLLSLIIIYNDAGMHSKGRGGSGKLSG